MQEDVETWLTVPGFAGYDVSDMGRVRTWRKNGTGKSMRDAPLIMRPGAIRGGYHGLALRRGGVYVNAKVHRLVLEAFVGPCPDGMECRHFPDRTRTNNRLSNLQWGTRRENMEDQRVHGTLSFGGGDRWRDRPELISYGDRNGSRTCPESRPRGSKHWYAAHDERKVRMILLSIAAGVFRRHLATHYQVCIATIDHIATGRSWKHVERAVAGELEKSA